MLRARRTSTPAGTAHRWCGTIRSPVPLTSRWPEAALAGASEMLSWPRRNAQCEMVIASYRG